MTNNVIIRERTPFWLMVYGVYVYFCSTSYRRASKILEPWVERSHVALWSWFQKLGILAERFAFSGEGVRSFLVDETQIKVGGKEAWLWLAFVAHSKVTGLPPLQSQKHACSLRIPNLTKEKVWQEDDLMDGGTWYIQAAGWARLKHFVYDDDTRNIV